METNTLMLITIYLFIGILSATALLQWITKDDPPGANDPDGPAEFFLISLAGALLILSWPLFIVGLWVAYATTPREKE